MSLLSNSLLISRGHDSVTQTTVSLGDGKPQDTRLKGRASLSALGSLIRDPVTTFADYAHGWADGLSKEERQTRIHIQARRQVLYLNLRKSITYEEWVSAATELDQLEGNDLWKHEADSPHYSPEEIRARLDQLESARTECDIKRMLFLVRTSLTRNLGNMGNLQLYKHAHVGTKDLIERYIDSALATLDALLQYSERTPANDLEPRKMLDQVLAARQAFGRSALLLSGGANFGMYHSGVLKALWRHKLLPRIISGASAGSIVCAALCTRTDEEVPELLETFCHNDLSVFEAEDEDHSIMAKVRRILQIGSLFDIQHLTRVMRDLLGDLTFQEAYNRTRRILNICVSSASLYELPRLLNYITAPNVLIWSAVAASCSVPFVFSAASILAKNPKTGATVPWNPSPQKWIDGSVDNDLPMTRLAEMFNVNHFIVSQVNPHVVPFLVREETSALESDPASQGPSSGPSWLHTITSLAKSEAIYRMHTMIDAGIFPNTLTKTVSVLSQKYSGDITILPEISYTDFPTMMTNPTVEFMVKAMLAGERATWPKFSRIRNHLAIELALDDAVQRLRTRVVFDSSEANLRLGDYSKVSRGSANVPRNGSRMARSRQHRKPSHSSELDHSITEALKKGHNPRVQRESRHKTQSIDLPWSRLAADENGVAKRAIAAAAASPTLLSDVLSSGAETSNMYTSDSFADQSSVSSSSPLSPSSPAESDWDGGDGRERYSASVPVTPAAHRRRTSFMNLTPMDGVTSPNEPSRQASGSETPRPSVQEARYKRLFHSSKTRVTPGASKAVPLTSPPSSGGEGRKKGVKRLNALGLEIDLSGTRNMVSRRKAP